LRLKQIRACEQLKTMPSSLFLVPDCFAFLGHFDGSRQPLAIGRNRPLNL
jgi:hypothetical protein